MCQKDKAMRWELSTSPHGQLCVSKEMSREEVSFWLLALRANSMDDPFYQRRHKARPFGQCIPDHGKAGYVLIEFWSNDKESIMDYLHWLDSVYDKTVARLSMWL